MLRAIASVRALLGEPRVEARRLAEDVRPEPERGEAAQPRGAGLILVSAQKYLAEPTAGLVLGRRVSVPAVAAQQRGIGRAMKPTEEALASVIAAVTEREALDLPAW